MSDTLYGGRRFRTLNVLDEGVREGLAIEVDTSLPADRVGRVLEQVVTWRGQPQAIRLDNGPALVAERFMAWCAEPRDRTALYPAGQTRSECLHRAIQSDVSYRGVECLCIRVPRSGSEDQLRMGTELQRRAAARCVGGSPARHVSSPTGSPKFSLGSVSLTGELTLALQ